MSGLNVPGLSFLISGEIKVCTKIHLYKDNYSGDNEYIYSIDQNEDSLIIQLLPKECVFGNHNS